MKKTTTDYPLAVRKGDSDFFYIYFNDVDRPIDAKKIGKFLYRYDTLKGFDIGEPIEVKSILD